MPHLRRDVNIFVRMRFRLFRKSITALVHDGASLDANFPTLRRPLVAYIPSLLSQRAKSRIGSPSPTGHARDSGKGQTGRGIYATPYQGYANTWPTLFF